MFLPTPYGGTSTECVKLLFAVFQQWRLLPYLAATYVMEHYHVSCFMDFVAIRIGALMGDRSENQVKLPPSP